jgi:hypothetical protein
MYSGLQSTATDMLKNFGTSATLIKAVPGSFDPATGADDTSQVHTCEVFAVFVGASTKYKDKFTIQSGDSIALVAPIGGTFVSPPAHYFPGQEVIPEQNDILNGWTILDVEEVNPAGTVVLYKCHVRKQ